MRYPRASVPVDGENSSHGTHVAGIAAGNPRTEATGSRRVSGIAPRAYIGNYKALVGTDSGLSPNGNAPELVAAIEAAVRDGMDVINLSIGEPEIEPRRDVVALALDAAARAGVVPVVAAGNDFNDFGAGTVSSPANSAAAITVAAFEVGGDVGLGRARRLLRGRPDDDVTPPEARRGSTRRGRSLVRARGMGVAVRNEHGLAAHRWSGGAPRPPPPDLDAGAGEVGAGADGDGRAGRRQRCSRP